MRACAKSGFSLMSSGRRLWFSCRISRPCSSSSDQQARSRAPSVRNTRPRYESTLLLLRPRHSLASASARSLGSWYLSAMARTLNAWSGLRSAGSKASVATNRRRSSIAARPTPGSSRRSTSRSWASRQPEASMRRKYSEREANARPLKCSDVPSARWNASGLTSSVKSTSRQSRMRAGPDSPCTEARRIERPSEPSGPLCGFLTRT
mmetsp:Transcript_50091/g.134062  ORF Transcript_50091/g.134062 Transcript_50091/m.134062 type:complete len:207 (-) Transcript_50091:61-681(-)